VSAYRLSLNDFHYVIGAINMQWDGNPEMLPIACTENSKISKEELLKNFMRDRMEESSVEESELSRLQQIIREGFCIADNAKDVLYRNDTSNFNGMILQHGKRLMDAFTLRFAA
jgi:hypothetical protein